jgi:hypothetical protein
MLASLPFFASTNAEALPKIGERGAKSAKDLSPPRADIFKAQRIYRNICSVMNQV